MVALRWAAPMLTMVAVVPVSAQRPSVDSAAVIAVVRQFNTALHAADSAAVLRLLAPDAQILESGSIETREEYRSHHLAADIDFVRATSQTLRTSSATVRGDVAWVTSTSKTTGTVQGRAINSIGAELMVLDRTSTGWQIRAIHWSSRRSTP